jgi:drug/metabolite transporter (DMT)-like permease
MKKYVLSTKLIPIILAGISAALFGLATPISKILLDSSNPFLLAGLLYLGASIGLLPKVILKKELFFILKLNNSNLKRLLGAIILGGIIGTILILIGLKYSSASSVSLWLNFELIATAVLGFLFFKDYLGKKGWIGVFIALTSGIILTINEGHSGVISSSLIIAACICWGFDNHFTALIDGISATQSTFLKGLFAGIINTIIGISISNISISTNFIIYSLILGSISYGISIVLYIISAQKLGAIRSQIIFSSAPFFGVIFSMLLLSESITILQMISFVLLLISISLMTYDRHEHFHEHFEIEHTHYHHHDDMHHEHNHTNKVLNHEHLHNHINEIHSHPHWPDLHHRHDHK